MSDRVLVDTPIVVADGRGVGVGAERERLVADAVRRALRRLTAQGARVVVVATPPRAEPADCVTRRRVASCDDESNTTHDPPTRALARVYGRVLPGLGRTVAYVTIDDMLCPGGDRCPAVVGGLLARYDQIHYTAAASRLIVPVIIARAERAGIDFSGR